MGSVEISGKTLATVVRRISPSARVPTAKYAPRSLKAAAPMGKAKTAAAAAPASIARRIGVPRLQSVRATRAPSPKKAAWPRFTWPT